MDAVKWGKLGTRLRFLEESKLKKKGNKEILISKFEIICPEYSRAIGKNSLKSRRAKFISKFLPPPPPPLTES
jgi:hypothetical protein